jgi:hypothetical protein
VDWYNEIPVFLFHFSKKFVSAVSGTELVHNLFLMQFSDHNGFHMAFSASFLVFLVPL